MMLREICCSRFGGISDFNIELKEGLNVILGPNEAGKSTVVDSIFSVFFRSHKLKKNTTVGKEFYEKYLPYPDGDCASVKVVLKVGGLEYEINKEWGASPSAYIRCKDRLIKDERAVSAAIQELLVYGESTYRNIIFARQSDIKGALQRIKEDSETTSTVDNVLKQAVMVLDGISVEKFKKKIEEKLEIYGSKWDVENNRPEKARYLDDPWKKGKGLVLDSFYEKERIKNEIEKAKKIEENYVTVSELLKEIKDKKIKIKKKLNDYGQMEGEIEKRAHLEYRKGILEKKAEELREVSRHFAEKRIRLKNLKRESIQLKEKLGRLNKELGNAVKIKEAEEAEKMLAQIRRLEEDLKNKFRERDGLAAINDNEIDRMDNLYTKMTSAKAALEAGKLIGSINNAGERRMVLTCGLEKKEICGGGEEFTADGYLRVEVEDLLELEVKAGEIKYEELVHKYKQAKEELEKLLEKFGASDPGEAKAKFSIYKKTVSEIESMQERLFLLKAGRNIEELKSLVEETRDLSARSIEEINKENEEAKALTAEVSQKIIALEVQINEWTDKYESPEKAIDELADTLASIKEVEKELSKLVKLPPEFQTPEQFREILKQLKAELEEVESREQRLKDQFYEIDKNLPDISCEELESLQKEAEARFQKRLSYLQNLIKIKKIFDSKMEELDRGSFDPLVSTFSRYLSVLTLGKYTAGEISEDFEVGILKGDNTYLPENLFSAGAYDCVLLALRFALLDYLFQGKSSIIILDDCLVNLDPGRREKAAELLRKYAETNQVIFTTCDPATADLLKGNIISI